MNGFKVDTGQIRKLASEFGTQAQALQSAVGGFQGPARSVDKAFGLLGPSDDAYNQYQTAVDHAMSFLQGTGSLLAALRETEAGLKTTADNYDRAEQASTVQGAGG